jgi:hypothetical protein
MRRTIPSRRRRLSTSWLAVVALSTAGATGGLVLSPVAAAAAGADPIGNCSATVGVIVAVDFGYWGGDIERGCDATLTTGYAALHEAGFTTAGDAQDGAGFVCRIDDKPTPAQDPCTTTPPADAYWSYWHADAGQDTWTYSEVGAMSYHPPPGSVDAWTFGSTDIDGTDGQPTFPPSAVRAAGTSTTSTTTVTTPTTTPTPTPATTPPATTSSSLPGPSTSGTAAAPPSSARSSSSSIVGGGGAGAGRGTVPPTAARPTTTTSLPPDRDGTTRVADGRRTPKIVDALPVATDRRSAGSPVPLIVGAAVVVALAGAAGLAARRRRRMS